MCGFFGAINFNKFNIDRIKDTLTRRGPDGVGIWKKDKIYLFILD